jgi:hypothetical protein
MDQKKRIELYVQTLRNIHQKNPELKQKIQTDFTAYEQEMAQELPRFKEKYPTLFRMAIREFDDPTFNRKLSHFLNISHNVLTGRNTLDEATKQVAQEQYDEYVAPIVKTINKDGE